MSTNICRAILDGMAARMSAAFEKKMIDEMSAALLANAATYKTLQTKLDALGEALGKINAQQFADVMATLGQPMTIIPELIIEEEPGA